MGVPPRSSWPSAFAAELNSSYSAALYGSAGRVPANLRVVWPALLSESARLSLNGAVACASSSRLPPNALYFGDGAIQHQQTALWVYQPGDLPFAPSGSTVEVAHCAYSGARGGDDVRPSRSPMWFHVMPGSGITVEVGRTLLASPQTFGRARSKHMHAALVSGDFRSFHRLLRNLTEAEEDAAEVRCWREARPQRRGCFPAPRA
mmetsp:Transcript_3769/g.12150  ORF Transcript_3769/g.12150 Transcript_3769/m.12150 type:complete len:205 (+) Transcript_3769:79-693(+)